MYGVTDAAWTLGGRSSSMIRELVRIRRPDVPKAMAVYGEWVLPGIAAWRIHGPIVAPTTRILHPSRLAWTSWITASIGGGASPEGHRWPSGDAPPPIEAVIQQVQASREDAVSESYEQQGTGMLRQAAIPR